MREGKRGKRGHPFGSLHPDVVIDVLTPVARLIAAASGNPKVGIIEMI